jgi:uncharacterized membrane-anchored protein
MQDKNLPTIDARYWTAILAASMCGANTGDFASRILNLGHTRGLLPLALIFLGILWAERRSTVTTQAYYWLAIIVLRTGATNLADLATHDLKLGYVLVEIGLAALMIVVLLVDQGRAETAGKRRAIDGSWRRLPATTASYWVVMLAAGTLGTALGDWVADEWGLGVGLGSIVLLGILAIVLALSTLYGRMTKPWYWLSIVAARTAGTTMGDFLASRHGLNLGLPVSTLCTSILLAGIVLLWRGHVASGWREA